MRHPRILSRQNTILLVVDIQEKLAAVMDERERVVQQSLRMIRAAHVLDVPVLVTEQYSKGLGPTVPELREALEGGPQAVEKLTFSCCGEEGVLNALGALPERDTVLLVGMEAHVCVYQTALDLMAHEYAVHLAADAVCSRRPRDEQIALDGLRGLGVTVTTVESAIFQLLEQAGTAEFKEILKLVK